MLADVSKINESAYLDKNDKSPKDYQFCRRLTSSIFFVSLFSRLSIFSIFDFRNRRDILNTV